MLYFGMVILSVQELLSTTYVCVHVCISKFSVCPAVEMKKPALLSAALLLLFFVGTSAQGNL